LAEASRLWRGRSFRRIRCAEDVLALSNSRHYSGRRSDQKARARTGSPKAPGPELGMFRCHPGPLSPRLDCNDIHVSNFAALLKQMSRNQGRQVIVKVRRRQLAQRAAQRALSRWWQILGVPGEGRVTLRTDWRFLDPGRPVLGTLLEIHNVTVRVIDLVTGELGFPITRENLAAHSLRLLPAPTDITAADSSPI
jgi:hypothetical protein